MTHNHKDVAKGKLPSEVSPISNLRRRRQCCWCLRPESPARSDSSEQERGRMIGVELILRDPPVPLPGPIVGKRCLNFPSQSPCLKRRRAEENRCKMFRLASHWLQRVGSRAQLGRVRRCSSVNSSFKEALCSSDAYPSVSPDGRFALDRLVLFTGKVERARGA